MKGNSFKLFLSIVVLFMTMLACASPLSGGSQSAATALPPTPQNTEAAAQPTATQPSKYFQEDFSGNLSNWSQFVVNGSKVPIGGNSMLVQNNFGNMTVGVKDGFLVFDLESPGQWIYEIYDAQQYDDVRLDVSAENRGNNDNNISLICRYSPDQGWYEFNIANNGLYNIYYAQVQADNTVVYSKIADGGYNKIKQGKDTNQIGISCVGRTLTLFINNFQVKQLDDNQYVLKSGKIGISVSSFTDPPAIVGFDWVKVSQPQ
ncbi:MAG TPA: hypothetical protein VIN60_07085 [Anaerolineales bacterium]